MQDFQDDENFKSPHSFSTILSLCTHHIEVTFVIFNHDLQQFVSGSPAPGLYIRLCSGVRTAHL